MSTELKSGDPAGKRPTCPVCKKDSIEQYRPFCSRRCADIDLGRWLVGGYAIAGCDDDDDTNQRPADQKHEPDST